MVAAALILVGIVLYSGLQYLESTVLYQEQPTEVRQTSRTITRDGKDYYPRQDITTFLVMGIDEYGPVKDSMSYNNEGESDVVLLVIFDEAARNCQILALNRDTMVEMPILGLSGKKAGTKVAQLAVAHTYGSGLEDSCENVVETISLLLGDDFIDYYIAMNMDAIAILNDAVGGVTVNVVDDFSRVNPSITLGEITLHGQQAIDFVQTRKDVGDQTNITRMKRQEEYVKGFLEALHRKADTSADFILKVYNDLSPYIVTDCSSTVLSDVLERYEDYDIMQVVSPAGDAFVVDGHYQFFVDEADLDRLIVDLLYAPKHS